MRPDINRQPVKSICGDSVSLIDQDIGPVLIRVKLISASDPYFFQALIENPVSRLKLSSQQDQYFLLFGQFQSKVKEQKRFPCTGASRYSDQRRRILLLLTEHIQDPSLEFKLLIREEIAALQKFVRSVDR